MFRTIGIRLLGAFLVAAVGCGGNPVTTVNTLGVSNPLGNSNPVAPNPPSPSGTISIFPASETLRTGAQRRFSGWDSSVGQYDVTWSLQEGAAAGNITADGVYTAPDMPGIFHLIATSAHNSSLHATATLNIVGIGFVPISDMITARSGHTATTLLDGRVLVAGGTADSVHSAELFIPALGTFLPTTGGMVFPRPGHCASLLPDGRVLIAGGNAKANFFKTAEVFDPLTQTFSVTSNLIQERTGATATLLANGQVLITGGQDSGGNLLSSAELYDPSTETFKPTGNMNLARAQHTATLLSNGKVLLIGSLRETSSAELFDPISGAFRTTGSMIQARVHHTATLLPNDNVLVLGGTQIMEPLGGGAAPAAVSLDSAEIYESATAAFRTAGKLLIARDFHSATLLRNGTVLVAGGYSHGFDGDADPEWNSMFVAELFDPIASISTEAASLKTDRAEHVATLLGNGQILITGGIAGSLQLCCSPNPYTVTLAGAELYK